MRNIGVPLLHLAFNFLLDQTETSARMWPVSLTTTPTQPPFSPHSNFSASSEPRHRPWRVQIMVQRRHIQSTSASAARERHITVTRYIPFLPRCPSPTKCGHPPGGRLVPLAHSPSVGNKFGNAAQSDVPPKGSFLPIIVYGQMHAHGSYKWAQKNAPD